MTTDPSIVLYRSEAFAEDLAGFVAPPAEPPAPRPLRRLRRLQGWLPLGVALLGVAFAVIPPLG